MNRRGALVTIGLTAFGGVAWSISRPLLLGAELTDANFTPFGTESSNALDDRLSKDIAHLSPRVYSEEGIPVFLACENLVPTSPQPAKVALTPMNTALAAAFHRNAEAWQRIHPHAQAKEVAQLIEVLAYRDFTDGGTAEQQ